MATATTPKLATADLAALAVAARRFEKERDLLPPGIYQICRRVLIHGVVEVGAPTEATAPPDYTGVLGFVLASLSPRALRRIERALETAPDITEEQRALAREVCALLPRDTIERRGALKGAIEVDTI